jgi:hypothetical protein
MTTISVPSRRTLSPVQIGLLVVVGLLALTVEALIMRAYFNSVNTAAFFREASYIVTNQANVQREALLLQVETDRVLHDPARSFNNLGLRRSLLANQLRLQVAEARGDPHLTEALQEIGATLEEYDAY